MEVNFKKTDKILIVSPHPDDETIGCGGLLAKYGPQCDILILTDGRLGNIEKYKDTDKLIALRKQELNNAMKIAKVNNIFFLDIEDSTLSMNKDKVKSFNIVDYDYIFVPNRYETHSDHKPVLKIITSMKSSQRSKAQIYEYEVWTPLHNPTWNLNISDVVDIKKQMLKEYKSQISEKDYVKASIGLNAYRGLACDYKYAEAYTNSAYSDFAGKIYEMMPDSIKTLAHKIVSK